MSRTLAPLDSLVVDYSDSLRSDRGDDLVKGLAIGTNVASGLAGASDQDLDLSGLLKRASDLSDLVRGMVGTVGNEENGLDRFGDDSSYGAISDLGKSAVDLKNATKMLGGEGDYFGQDASLINESFVSPRVNNTVSDVMQAVANNITSKSQFLKSEAADNLAKDLAALSAAARTGKKNEMLLASKSAANNMNILTKELLEYASKIEGSNARERQAQDTLVRCANGLRNFATHLKILTAVKAASIHETKDTDHSLTTLVTELGDIISMSMDTLIKAHEVNMVKS